MFSVQSVLLLPTLLLSPQCINPHNGLITFCEYHRHKRAISAKHTKWELDDTTRLEEEDDEEEEGYVEARMTEQGHGKMKQEWRGMSHPHGFPVDWNQRSEGVIKIIESHLK